MAKAHEVATSLIDLIENRTFRDGQRLPSERELCERFGSARNTVRRALSMLSDVHQVIRHVPNGGYVVDQGRMQGGGIAPLLGASGQISPADIMEVRLIVEPSAAAIASVRASGADLDYIEETVVKTARAGTIVEREAFDAEFHTALFRMTRNPMLVWISQAINAVRESEEWVDNKQKILSAERQCAFDDQHMAIVAALRKREPDEARAAMRAHIESLRKELLGEFLV